MCWMLLRAEVSLASVPCTPARGKTALIIGQDYRSILEYSKSIEKPFGFMTYTAISFNSSESLAGLKFPVDYGSGIEWSKGLLEFQSGSSLQIGLYLVNSCGYIMTGLLDGYIDELGSFLKKYSEHSIYLRIGYEFDSEENNYSLRIQPLFGIPLVLNRVMACRLNVLCHVFASNLDDDIEWFPGDEYVDWCGVSLFQQPYDCQTIADCRFLYAEVSFSILLLILIISYRIW